MINFLVKPLESDEELYKASEACNIAWQAAYRNVISSTEIRQAKTEYWNRKLSEKGRHSLIATVEDEVVGVISFGTNRDGENSFEVGEILSLYVLPEFQGNQIGTTLLCEAEQELKNLHFQEAILWVQTANKSAKKFYEKLGWQSTGRVKKNIVLNEQLQFLKYQKALS